MRPLALLAILTAAALLTACAGGICWRDNSGVERAPDSTAPDPHKGPTGR